MWKLGWLDHRQRSRIPNCSTWIGSPLNWRIIGEEARNQVEAADGDQTKRLAKFLQLLVLIAISGDSQNRASRGDAGVQRRKIRGISKRELNLGLAYRNNAPSFVEQFEKLCVNVFGERAAEVIGGPFHRCMHQG